MVRVIARTAAMATLVTGLALAMLVGGTASPLRINSTTACSMSMSILESPRLGSREVQAKALNDGGDVVGFADGRDGTYRAILWKGGKVAGAVDLGLLPGYVSSEAYGVNNDRVVFGLLYDRKERTFPFRWEDGRMTVLRGPNGRIQQADVPDRNAINQRSEMAGTLLVAGNRRAVRWTREGKATFLPGLPGHAWTNAWSINSGGVVSGWSRKLPNDDGENNPVVWDGSTKVVPLKTAAGRADGAAEATNRSGLIVGYLGNLGTPADPERGNAVVWQSRTAQPRLLGRPAPPYAIAELVDVNDRGQAAGMSGNLTKNGFPLSKPAIWRTGWTSLRPLRIPPASRKSRVVVTNLNDVNRRGDIVGNVYGLAAPDFSALRRIDPVLWTCAFGR
jgi:probable HAF family extracellular repeat protein